MDTKKQQALEETGWQIGSTEQFLNLSPEEASYIELKLALGESLRDVRQRQNLTQREVATLLKSSQSRVAKMEAGDPTVSLDLLVRSLLSLGITRVTLANLIAAGP